MKSECVMMSVRPSTCVRNFLTLAFSPRLFEQDLQTLHGDPYGASHFHTSFTDLGQMPRSQGCKKGNAEVVFSREVHIQSSSNFVYGCFMHGRIRSCTRYFVCDFGMHGSKMVDVLPVCS